MRFSEYVESKPHGEMKRIERLTGVGYTTLLRAKSEALHDYGVAKKISDATGGVVTIAELCEPLTQAAEEPSAA